jgi:hypothetical protein
MPILTRAEHVLQELAAIRLVHDGPIEPAAVEMAHCLGGIASMSIAFPQPIIGLNSLSLPADHRRDVLSREAGGRSGMPRRSLAV